MDYLDYMLPDQVWALSTHLAATEHPILTTVIGNQIWYMKSKDGFPWDMNTFDDAYIYQSITEVSWENPRAYKIFASETWPNANGGILWSPRKTETNVLAPGFLTADSSYRNYSDCSNYSKHDLGGPTLAEVFGPMDVDFGGDLKVQSAIKQVYRWGAGYQNIEVNHYAKGYGWAQWELWEVQNGQFVQKDITAFNKFESGGSPQPVFPCGVPKLGALKS